MLVRTSEQTEAAKRELEGTKSYKFSDTVTVEGTGVFKDMPKGKQYPKVHRLCADVLVEKKYAKVV